jgi:hypothetical protein
MLLGFVALVGILVLERRRWLLHYLEATLHGHQEIPESGPRRI